MPSTFLKDYFKEMESIFGKLNADEFADFIKELTEAYSRSSQIFICGNGGSASTASHFACDMNKGVDFKGNSRFKVICLNDNIPTILAYANDLSYSEIFVEQLKNFMNRDDLVIGVSASGNSENVLKTILYANEQGAKTFGICGYDGGRLKTAVQKSIVINSNDMQKVEDLHMVIFHCATQWFNKKFKETINKFVQRNHVKKV